MTRQRTTPNERNAEARKIRRLEDADIEARNNRSKDASAAADGADAAAAAAIAAHVAEADPHPQYLTPAEGDAAYAPLSHVGAGGAEHANVVAAGAAGFMTGADKTKLDGIASGATAYTDEQAQDAVGAMVDASLTYVDGTPLLQRAALTGDVTAAAGSNATTIANDAVTLAKMANVASSTVFYRKTAAAGDPEVQTLATLKTDLGLTGTNSGDQTSIVGITGTLAEFNAALTGADFASGGGTVTGASSGTNTGDQTSIVGITGTKAQFDTACSDGNFAYQTDLAGYQPLDATLTALAAANWAANSLPIGSGADTVAQVTFAAGTFPARASAGNLVAKPISDDALAFLAAANDAAMRAELGLGTAAVVADSTLAHLAGTETFTGLKTFDLGATDRLSARGTVQGRASVDQTTFGILLTAVAMSAAAKYTPGILFGSTDTDLAADIPKVGAGIFGYATETYDGVTKGGMGIEFFGAANAPGAAAAPTSLGTAHVANGWTINLATGATAITQSAGDNSTKVCTTAYFRTNSPNASYRNIIEREASHTAGKTAAKYAIPSGDAAAVSGTGTLYPQGVFYYDPADHPTIDSLAPKLRIRAQVYCNDVAPTGTYIIGLYPVTRPATSGAAGVCIYTLGTVVSGSETTTVNAPAADSSSQVVGSDFAAPTAGHYVLGFVQTGTVAASAHMHIAAQLQMRNA